MIIFYDGYCPLCRTEMRHLKKHDKRNAIQFEDIQAAEFPHRFPDLDWEALNARIHVQLPDGSLVSGLDATHRAWSAVGKGWLYAPLRWPGIRVVADYFYTLFARHRYTISYWLTGQKRSCDTACKPEKFHE